MNNKVKSKLATVAVTFGAVFALTAIAAQAASAALPEYVLPAGQSFPVKFTWTNGELDFVTTAGEKRTCKSGAGTGEFVNSKEDRVALTFLNCTTTFFGFPISCTTPGQSAGTIVTNPLKSHLYYAPGTKMVVNDLQPLSGTAVAEFECAGNTVALTGSLIGTYSTVNRMSHTNSLVLIQSGGIQNFIEYETESGSKVKDVLFWSNNGGTPVQTGLETADTITFEAKRELEVRG